MDGWSAVAADRDYVTVVGCHHAVPLNSLAITSVAGPSAVVVKALPDSLGLVPSLLDPFNSGEQGDNCYRSSYAVFTS